MASSEPRLRSFSAERATHSRNRYRTAKKPNFRPTAIGSSSTRLLQFEGHSGGPDLDHVAAFERLRPLDAAAVDLDPVGRAQVVDDPRAAGRTDLGVVAGDVRVVD